MNKDPIGKFINGPLRKFNLKTKGINKLLGIGILLLSILIFYVPRWKQASYESQYGLIGHYYAKNDFSYLFKKRQDLTVNFSWKSNPPLRGMSKSPYSIRWEGLLIIEKPGEYTFETISGGQSKLWINDKSVIDRQKKNKNKKIARPLYLEKGKHSIKLDYVSSPKNSQIKLLWRPSKQKTSKIIAPRFFRPTTPKKGQQ